MAIWRRTVLLVACALSVLVALPVAAAEQPIGWVVQGKSTTLAKAAVKILEQAGDEGLNPSDYDAAGLSK
ncbi:MAG: hypothetical protein ACKOW6_06825 [Fluviibacter sp.]